METDKILTYVSMGIAGLVGLVFLLDAGLRLFGRESLALDIMFIIGAVFVLWQGFETTRELR
jgi:hypothetical protein